MARDEYYAYLPKVFSLLRESASGEKIAEYLVYIVTERMALQETKEHAMAIAVLLQEWKEALDEKYA